MLNVTIIVAVDRHNLVRTESETHGRASTHGGLFELKSVEQTRDLAEPVVPLQAAVTSDRRRQHGRKNELTTDFIGDDILQVITRSHDAVGVIFARFLYVSVAVAASVSTTMETAAWKKN